MSQSSITMLGEAQLTTSGHDVISVELAERDNMPALVKITWPLHPSVVDAQRFPDAAAVIVKLFADAHTRLAGIKARRKL